MPVAASPALAGTGRRRIAVSAGSAGYNRQDNEGAFADAIRKYLEAGDGRPKYHQRVSDDLRRTPSLYA